MSYLRVHFYTPSSWLGWTIRLLTGSFWTHCTVEVGPGATLVCNVYQGVLWCPTEIIHNHRTPHTTVLLPWDTLYSNDMTRPYLHKGYSWWSSLTHHWVPCRHQTEPLNCVSLCRNVVASMNPAYVPNRLETTPDAFAFSLISQLGVVIETPACVQGADRLA